MTTDASAKRVKTPQQVCQHKPCWCGRPLLHAFQPYDAEKAAAWLAERAAARATSTAEPRPND